MAEEKSRIGNIRLALRSPIPWIVLAILLAATIGGWHALWREASRDAAWQFERRTESAEAAMRVRMRANEQMLVAGAAHLASSKDVTRAQWAEFVAGLKLGERYPGIQAIGFAERVRRADRDGHVKRVRADGLAEYDIRPPGDRDDYIPIVYSEPFKGRNARVVGIDTYSQPVLRTAIDRAFELGEAAVTAKVVLPGEDAAGAERTQTGFVMYVPVFRPGKPVATKAERDVALQGFVFGTFRMNELAAGALDRGVAQALDMAIYDGTQVAPETLLFDARQGAKAGGPAAVSVFQRTGSIELGGRRWMLVFTSSPDFDSRAQDAIPLGLLAAGLAASAAIFSLTLLLVAARTRTTDVSTRDVLTQIFNSHYLEETMAIELARARREKRNVGLILIDIDRFKAVEDEFGAGCGEHILKEFARLLEKNTRDSDIACRLGGAQFALGMPGASVENARTRAERLREVLESTAIECGGKPLGQVTLCAGAAAYPQHGEDWASLLQRAHRALYAAKNAGRNKVAVAE